MRFDFILLSRDARASSPLSRVRFDIFARYQWVAETERQKWSSWPRHERTRARHEKKKFFLPRMTWVRLGVCRIERAYRAHASSRFEHSFETLTPERAATLQVIFPIRDDYTRYRPITLSVLTFNLRTMFRKPMLHGIITSYEHILNILRNIFIKYISSTIT